MSLRKVRADSLKVGDTIMAIWRDLGDDVNLTGRVIKRLRCGNIIVRWNGDGDVTSEGDESEIYFSCPVEQVVTD